MAQIRWRRERWVVGTILGMTIVIIGLVIFLRQPAVTVETGSVEYGELRTLITAEGRTRIHDRFVVAAPVTGQLERIELHRGDEVVLGSIIARIQPPSAIPLDARQLGVAEARLSAAEAAWREAEALVGRERTALSQVRRERQRAGQLIESGDLPRQEFERLTTAESAGEQQLLAAQARTRAALAEVEAARAALIATGREAASGHKVEAVTIRAPVGGRLLKLYEESERVVTAGTPLLEISNPETLELVIEVLSSDAVRIRPGAGVIGDRWGGDRQLRGTVRVIEPSAFTRTSALGIEEQRVKIIADLVERPEGLGDGYRVEAGIIVYQTPRALKVPLSSLFRDGNNWAVYVVDGDRATLQPVRIGQRSETETEILDGLSAGTRVILHPPNDLTPGGQIRIR